MPFYKNNFARTARLIENKNACSAEAGLGLENYKGFLQVKIPEINKRKVITRVKLNFQKLRTIRQRQ